MAGCVACSLSLCPGVLSVTLFVEEEKKKRVSVRPAPSPEDRTTDHLGNRWRWICFIVREQANSPLLLRTHMARWSCANQNCSRTKPGVKESAHPSPPRGARRPWSGGGGEMRRTQRPISARRLFRKKTTTTHRVVFGEAVLVHLHDLPGGDVEAQHSVVGEHRLLAHERLAQAVLPSLPPASHGRPAATVCNFGFGTHRESEG